MTTSTPEAEPRHIAPPVMREDRPFCPRCDSLLRFEHDEYVCLACGYEYLLEPRDVELIREARRGMRKAAATIPLPLAAVPFSGGFVVVLAGILAIGGAIMILSHRRRARVA